MESRKKVYRKKKLERHLKFAERLLLIFVAALLFTIGYAIGHSNGQGDSGADTSVETVYRE
ncbi:hypothetical protein CPT_Mater41 [Bacillus phage Mater]|uniref:Uncharacterized protein n=1 Tax=Bacillus phage Mater TaxID=1540090 RepID=A0A0A0RUG4_9CAUD|nr:hypothetical protein CPT_Mater41 [Bacillus phage Mater]AIW03198.1 hypothetical protein CPT_Mater41 [Bacillus phage Mater]